MLRQVDTFHHRLAISHNLLFPPSSLPIQSATGSTHWRAAGMAEVSTGLRAYPDDLPLKDGSIVSPPGL